MSDNMNNLHQDESQNIQKNVDTENQDFEIKNEKTEIEQEIEARLNGKFVKKHEADTNFRGLPKTLILSVIKVALPIVAFIIVVAVLVNVVQKKNQISEEAFVSVESTSESTEYAYEAPLEESKNEQLKSAVEHFYSALSSGDMETVRHILGELDDVEAITYQKKSEMIEAYQNLVCYTKPGLDADSCFLYVYYEAKLKGADTAAPGLNTWYAYPADDGDYHLLSDKNMPENVSAALMLVTNQDDVVDLFNRVDVKYNEAITADEELNTILANMLTKIREEVGIELAQLESTNQEEQENVETTDSSQENADSQTETPTTIEKVEQVKTTDTVRVRSSDSTEADLVGKAQKGTTLTRVEEKINGWSKVIFEGKEAYIKSDYLEVISSGVEQESIGVVKALENVNVRSSADQSASRIGGVQAGTSYNLLEKLDGWYKIDFNGIVGYVKAEYFE